jgi:predicted enzyme related to lactoylglutathione lyase
MAIDAQFAHVNLIAKDWLHLAGFYQKVFGCVPVPPERDLRGPMMEAGTGLPGAALKGVHMRLPGFGESGPTLEIFTYESLAEDPARAVNRPGFAHVAFRVEDIEAARQAVISAGGSRIGEIVTFQISSQAMVTWCYVTDPEGNIIELQTWAYHNS